MEWQIGNVKIPNQVVVAPMAGITNAAFRVICRQFGAGLVVCEMISDRGILHHNTKTLSMLFVDPTEHPVSVQIFGGTKETLVEAAKFVDQHTGADIIDINMGCPVNKVVKTDAGARWLLDPNKVYEMVSAVTAAVSKPVTVKMRTGWDEDHIYAVKNAMAAEKAGAAALAMHGRTRKQMYSGHADWNILKDVRDHISIPFMGNGDVRTPEDAKRMLDEVGATAVMIGRAALGNPWILKQTAEYLDDGILLPQPTPRQKIATAKAHLHRLVELKGEHTGVHEFRTSSAYYLKGIARAAKTKVAVNQAETEAEVDTIFDDFVEQTEARELERAK
ncbi:tRNA dihydrouridine synthase DusB [Loigolactobacillus coryniformis]|jgi:tRNA-dihydrouridine synthase B|uniref:tRNA-dihydrouridine synthase n=4 Tax=Loigolactobacillus coryniformis TaxID=1610 RepID=J3JB32_9LACO|nr:tRNA dihydrouridine synthase DusB [Loigolactobacillus coryniformis]MDT3390872.1 tRNA dihydrouridine synthase DusB [Bacillota bacterium]OEH90773.1 tRNA-dihydrouridine synthase [Loigolactobacillus coryniformis subsp. coryniformis]ATO42914.1 tRNA dihydrouridine synthase DusB [Loigolactobacillus coryniformis subsp. torquens DSM 20004 = KCTC 3535]ATO54665.1 tRNA dihydrouridine synthase DusB [Loigolactobacillus coryniformis subsp. coryniformis KCTC 3167 = DSM 20001]EJN55377.1 tRNA-dihydrouridine 